MLLVIFLVSLAFGIVCVQAYPQKVPVWSLFAIVGVSGVLLVPVVIMISTANIGPAFWALFNILGGLWFPGDPNALLIVNIYGHDFDQQAESYVSNLKMAHYAKLPPRAVFRGQVISLVINCFIFVGMLNFIVNSNIKYDLCEWNNPNHFVCPGAVSSFSGAVLFGAFGVRNMFSLYPILPWSFFIGGALGVVFGLIKRYGNEVLNYFRHRLSENVLDKLDKYFGTPFEILKYFDIAAFWGGTPWLIGGNNLCYRTNAVYISAIFMHYVRRRYSIWWAKYNYLIEAGFDVGIAVSAIIQTCAFQFGKSISLKWWGNTVSLQGVDFSTYANQNGSLLPIPDVGYFGPRPGNFPNMF